MYPISVPFPCIPDRSADAMTAALYRAGSGLAAVIIGWTNAARSF
ncbi:hypothetical protein PtrV1_12208 [Pyrenophora tritici-repentis]|uniref:Uncharacterized protein n=1 Tax=Pyrenophora tritici-repentis TaxID=45151 RepID=A0A5M9KPS5_9PLEO|nr:hypothetical protein PtrV1_12208 [Pyrenophora tritici-repentis]KAF7445015.1 hypothetical protein A1F99_100000 [Pyrenophora tritici-repentis]KAF7565279.1 hypothetical protein PtrM4_047130 [Pyrenophora tritici-repentis]KAI1512363.1 hypothetical protein Ptr86124_008329 [Pyrenophora tritici-repentis]KAI1663651.1 hypothetical protein L13192_12340 [Pyrenophora tritici-repentis]